MDGQRFDDLARVLGVSTTRKRFMAAVAGLVGVGAAVRDLERVEASKRGKKRKRRSGTVGAQGGGVCDALCSGSGPDSRFCGSIGNCGSDDDCIQQDPSRPICCTTGNCGGTGEGACCSAPTCAGPCDKGSCPDIEGCICDFDTNSCVSVLCGGECFKDTDCPPLAGCTCELPNGQEARAAGGPAGPDLGAQGATGPTGPGQCVTQTCGGPCQKDSDCPTAAGGCICEELSGECVTVSCPGRCNDNVDCREQGQDECACILFIDRSADVGTQGEAGRCGVCRGVADPCSATTECCGQLVCESGNNAGLDAEGFMIDGTCRRKKDPPKHCKQHGQACREDNDCCAQGVCYKGKCGEKDTHCNNDGECARGYRCQGGPLAPGHRRCRKNGRKRRNKTQRRHG